MTKEENELIRMCKPIKHRRIKRFNTYLKDLWANIKTKILYLNLDFRVLLGFAYHEKTVVDTSTDARVITKAAGSIVTNNVCFNVQVNSWERVVTHLDRYIDEKNGKILKDDSVVNRTTYFSAFPVDIQVRVKEENSFRLVNNYDDLVVRMPRISPPSYVVKYESYFIDLNPIKRLRVEKMFSNMVIESMKEKIEFENALCKDMVENLNQYMKYKFRFTDCLKKRYN